MTRSALPPDGSADLAIAGTEVHFLRSREVGDEFKLFVAHPVVRPAPGMKLPVIYVLDANGAFGTVTETARMLQIPGDTPNAYVVGIGYRRGPLIETLAIRSRDYTPTRWPLCEDVLGKGMGLSEPVVTGGGPAFLRFIRRELQPWVTSRFAADPADATIVGISFGGLFSTYTLLNEPDAFQRYIICSPSLFYDGELMLQHESAYAACHEDLRARVFMACGGLENRAEIERTYEKYPPELKANFARFGRVGMVELLEPFVERLRGRGYAGLRLAAHVFADEHHSSVFPAAVSRGLREVFQP